MRARAANLPLEDVMEKDIPRASPDAAISDLMPIAAEAKFPIAIIDSKGNFVGIVTKAAVLSSLT
jgi:glycine betaine/proline transport system ATP-binding protein